MWFHGLGGLGLAVIFSKSEDVFAKLPKQALSDTCAHLPMGCGEEGKQEQVLINLMKTIHKRIETYHELCVVPHVYLYDTSSGIRTPRT